MKSPVLKEWIYTTFENLPKVVGIMHNSNKLKLVFESKIRDLLPHETDTKKLEASGVLARNGSYFVVFDDRAKVARISNDFNSLDDNRLLGTSRKPEGFEGITYNCEKGRYYLLIESRKRKKGIYKAEIVEYDEDFEFVKQRRVDFIFDSANKGFEALAFIRRFEADYLLMLCEGNMCASGGKGKTPGGGRVQLFEKKKKRWAHCKDTIALPASVPFVDYSAMAIQGNRLAVVSQVNSMLWIGQFDEADWTWRDDGWIFEFPRKENGMIMYGNVEGVDWIGENRIVTVSDKRKKEKQPDKSLKDKDQSIQVFDIP